MTLGFQDDTLIKTKSGAKFGKDATDWILWHKIIPEKIKEYHKNGYKIVIFTNQNGISKGHTSEAVVKSKIQKIVAHVITSPSTSLSLSY